MAKLNTSLHLNLTSSCQATNPTKRLRRIPEANKSIWHQMRLFRVIFLKSCVQSESTILAQASKASKFMHDFKITIWGYHRYCCNLILWFTACRNVLRGSPHNHKFQNDPSWLYLMQFICSIAVVWLTDMLISSWMFSSIGYTWLSIQK